MRIFFKSILTALVSITLLFPLSVGAHSEHSSTTATNTLHVAQASAVDDPFYARFVGERIHLGSEDPVDIVVSLINVALSFLGIVLVVMILWGGLQYLLSGGKEEKTAAARKTIINAIIGVIIIMLAFSIVDFVVETVRTAVGV